MVYVNGSRLRGGKGYRQSEEYKEMIRRRDNYTCQKCGNPGRDVDHIIPFKQGGLSVPDNQRVLCHSCNLTGIKHPNYPKNRKSVIGRRFRRRCHRMEAVYAGQTV